MRNYSCHTVNSITNAFEKKMWIIPLSRMEFSTLIICTIRIVGWYFFIFIQILIKTYVSKQWRPWSDVWSDPVCTVCLCPTKRTPGIKHSYLQVSSANLNSDRARKIRPDKRMGLMLLLNKIYWKKNTHFLLKNLYATIIIIQRIAGTKIETCKNKSRLE